MNLVEINPEKTPEKFFSAYVDDAWVETELIASGAGIRLRRRADGGWQDTHYYEDQMRIYFIDETDMSETYVARGRVTIEAYIGDTWTEWDMPEPTITRQGDHAVRADFGGAGAGLRIDTMWRNGNSKQTFLGQYTGQLIRIKWEIQIRDERAIINIDDYDGNISDVTVPSQDYDTRTIIFEPDGVSDILTVDPYIEISVTAPSIVITCSEDTITFTVATADATLMEGSSLRAVVFEEYYMWTLYDSYMLRYRHDTGATTTGMAGNDYSLTNIGTEYDFFPLTSAVDTASSNYVTALQDSTMNDPSTGSWVDDLVYVSNYGADGFAVDGAIHVETTTSGDAAFDCDITRYEQTVVVHDFPYYTGTVGAETDHLVGHWKCNDNAATTTVVDTTGNNNGTLEGGDNTEDKDNADAVKGTSLLLNGTDDIIDLSSSISELTDTDKYTIIIKFKPNFAYNVGSDQTLISIGTGATNTDFLEYRAANDYFILSSTRASGTETSTTVTYSNDNILQQWHTLMISVNDSMNVCSFTLNGQTIGNGFEADWDSAPTVLNIGASVTDGDFGAYYIDEVKLIDGCVLPYGAYFTGANGSVDAANAHDDITFYWDGTDCTSTDVDIGGVQGTLGSANTGGATSFPTSGGIDGGYFDNESAASNYYISFPNTSDDIIDPTSCTISFWLNLQTLSTSNGRGSFGYYINGNNFIIGRFFSSGYMYFDYEAGNVRETTGNYPMTENTWYHIRLTVGDNFDVYIDNVLWDSDVIAGTWAGTSGSLLFASWVGGAGSTTDSWIDQAYVTNSPSTPMIPTINGVPLHVPQIQVG